MKTETRCFRLTAADVLAPPDFESVTNLYDFLQSEFDGLLGDERFVRIIMKHSAEFGNTFSQKVAEEYGKPFENWTISNPSRYYRILIAQAHDIIKSVVKRQNLAESCAQYLFDVRKFSEIRKHCFEQHKFYPTNADIRLVCNGQGSVSVPEHVSLKLNWAREDKQICTAEGLDYQFRVEKRWIDCHIDAPWYLRDNITKYCRPMLERIGEKYLLTVPYEITPLSSKSERVLGVDIGKVLPFVAVASEKGEYSQPLHPSKELMAAAQLADSYTERIKSVQRKNHRMLAEMRLEAMRHNTTFHIDLPTERRIHGRHQHTSSMKRHRTSIKRNFARLWARDVVSHAIEQGCGVIHIENLSKLRSDMGSDSFGLWNYADCFRELENLAHLHGIRVVKVRAGFTSKTDPFTNEKAVPNRNRLMKTEQGPLDRDYAAAINIARTESSVRSAPLAKRCRDKHSSTPRRPKAQRRNTEHKLLLTRTDAGSMTVPATSSVGTSADGKSNLSGTESEIMDYYPYSDS